MLSWTTRYIRRAMATGHPISSHTLIAAVQLTSGHDLNENFEIASSMIRRSAERGAKMVFFPECFDFVGRSREENISLAMPEDGQYIGLFRKAACEYGVWLSLGGFHNKVDGEACMPYNTHLIIDNHGETRGVYRKLHLFDLDIANKVRLMESEFSTAGQKLCKPVNTPVGNVAMSICYDLRFSELALWNRYNGAEILTYPSAFTVNTGLAHWESLLRARAIETQCYVVAAAQTGRHNNKRTSYGHAMVIDPWGAIIAQCSDTVGLCFAEISLDYLNDVRKSQPVFKHRRNDLYSIIANEVFEANEPMNFGDHIISSDVIFYRSDKSFAFVNRSSVLPGHVLVSPIRKVKRLFELTDPETADLFIVCKKVQMLLEKHYKMASSSVCVQDGPESGQTVSHVHVHILPRSKDDFGGNPDMLYHELANHDKKGYVKKSRSLEEMASEAAIYRSLVVSSAESANVNSVRSV